MSTQTIDTARFMDMFLAGEKRLEANKEWINDLNVFPVPDGDTGTNMTMTLMSAVREIETLENPTMETLAKAISSGSLRGARGNSGVILSQLLRGFTKEIRKAEKMDTVIIAAALQRASETAYKAVMKPKEGTVLTVARGLADKANEIAPEVDDIESFFEQIIAYGDEVLSRTPDMLPVLKEAGVLDSGGQGLMELMRGWLDGYMGREIEYPEHEENGEVPTPAQAVTDEAYEIKYGYCTEFMVHIDESYGAEQELEFREYLESLGDSIVLVSDGEVVKVHVHTNDPGLAIQKGISFGPLTNMKIDNMRDQYQEKLESEAAHLEAAAAKTESAPAGEEEKVPADEPEKPADPVQTAAEPRKEAGFVAVSVGDGMAEIFQGLGVDILIEGGQTMNPSTEDILNAIAQVNADTVYVLPNNKNIILSAEQAMKMTDDKQVIVVPTRTIPQGITAVISYMPGRSGEENLAQMMDEMRRVRTGQVTYAVRSTSGGGVEVHEGDIMGIDDHNILAVGSDVGETSFQLMKALVDDDSELLSLYYGEEVAESEAEALLARIEAEFPDRDIEMHRGGQPIYYYVMSVE